MNTTSAKVPNRVKKILEKRGAKVSKPTGKAPTAEKTGEEELRKALDEFASTLKDKIDPRAWAEIIDENRKSR
ncbi:hypothetical protein [Thermofilum pendens]|uniref:Uncharacterized protein n=1 Tax=Thermofilum pendens (strain DSM 2475 / Hrk 5) TaxID=368408 RepID=A1S0X5_THEPD|nr:hypothetical protein [Thermofilum pendens]ABL79105.1 hypothetical protein Tpen_1710 [Thermofilum pendens Hrk 5]